MIELPPDLAEVLKVVQSNEHGADIAFPNADEGLLAELAAAWEAWNEAAGTRIPAIVAGAQQARENMEGEAADSYQEYLQKYAGRDDSHAATTLDAGAAVAQSLRGAVTAVTQTKTEMVRELQYAKDYIDNNPAGKGDDVAQSEGVRQAADMYHTYVGQVGSGVDSMLRQNAGHVERMASAGQVCVLGGGSGSGTTAPGTVQARPTTMSAPGMPASPMTAQTVGLDSVAATDAPGALNGLPGDPAAAGVALGPDGRPLAAGGPGGAGGFGIPGGFGGGSGGGGSSAGGGGGGGAAQGPSTGPLRPYQPPQINLGSSSGSGSGPGTCDDAGRPVFRPLKASPPGLDLAGLTGAIPGSAAHGGSSGLAPWTPGPVVNTGSPVGNMGSPFGTGSPFDIRSRGPLGGVPGSVGNTSVSPKGLGGGRAGGAGGGSIPGPGGAGAFTGKGTAGGLGGGGLGGGGLGGGMPSRSATAAAAAEAGGRTGSGLGSSQAAARSGTAGGAAAGGTSSARPGATGASGLGHMGGGGGAGGGAGRTKGANKFLRPTRFGAELDDEDEPLATDSGVLGQATEARTGDRQWQRMRQRWLDGARGDEQVGDRIPPPAVANATPDGGQASPENTLLTQLAGALLGPQAAGDGPDSGGTGTATGDGTSPAATAGGAGDGVRPSEGRAVAGDGSGEVTDEAYLDRARSVAARRSGAPEGGSSSGSAAPAAGGSGDAAAAARPPLREEGGYQVPSAFLRDALSRLASGGAFENTDGTGQSPAGQAPAARPGARR